MREHCVHFHQAVEEKKYAEVKKMLAEGADINQGNLAGITPLHIASYNGDYDMVLLLLNEPLVTVDIPDDRQCTALSVAVERGHQAIASLLIAKGANVHWVDGDGYSLLHLAVCYNQIEMVRLLLEKKANINEHNEKIEFFTPLDVAMKFRNSPIGFELIRSGAKTNRYEEKKIPDYLGYSHVV